MATDSLLLQSTKQDVPDVGKLETVPCMSLTSPRS